MGYGTICTVPVHPAAKLNGTKRAANGYLEATVTEAA